LGEILDLPDIADRPRRMLPEGPPLVCQRPDHASRLHIDRADADIPVSHPGTGEDQNVAHGTMFSTVAPRSSCNRWARSERWHASGVRSTQKIRIESMSSPRDTTNSA